MKKKEWEVDDMKNSTHAGEFCQPDCKQKKKNNT